MHSHDFGLNKPLGLPDGEFISMTEYTPYRKGPPLRRLRTVVTPKTIQEAAEKRRRLRATNHMLALSRRARYPNPCEYSPERGDAAYEHEVHASATVIVGANGRWRLCDQCAALPKFNRFKVRTRIK